MFGSLSLAELVAVRDEVKAGVRRLSDCDIEELESEIADRWRFVLSFVS